MNSIAIIGSGGIKIFNRTYVSCYDDKHILHVKIKQLKSEKQTENISIQVRIGPLALTSTVTVQQIIDMMFYPGKRVVVVYTSENVRWK